MCVCTHLNEFRSYYIGCSQFLFLIMPIQFEFHVRLRCITQFKKLLFNQCFVVIYLSLFLALEILIIYSNEIDPDEESSNHILANLKSIHKKHISKKAGKFIEISGNS